MNNASIETKLDQIATFLNNNFEWELSTNIWTFINPESTSMDAIMDQLAQGLNEYLDSEDAVGAFAEIADLVGYES